MGPIANIISIQDNKNVKKLLSQIYERTMDFEYKVPSISKIDIKFNRNSLSAILGINLLNSNLLFLGDATTKTIKSSLNDIPKRNKEAVKLVFNPCFVKVGHHGAKNSTDYIIWDKLFDRINQSTFFGISAGRNKKNKHPDKKFIENVNKCCFKKNITHRIFRTNECAECLNQAQTHGEIDLDYWFGYHGCSIEDMRIEEAIENDAPLQSSIIERNPKKNLLAFIFEFSDISDNEPRVYKGVSKKISYYSECIYGEVNEHYCK